MLIFLINLIITIAIEVAVNKILFKNKDFAPSSKKVIAANAVSNPIAQIAHRIFFINLWAVELAVVVFESFFCLSKGKQYRNIFTVSLFLNLTSILVGILIYSFQIIL